MKLLISLGLILNMGSVFAHESFVLKQRAIMEAQLAYEENMNLMDVDPETCKLVVKKTDRIRVMKVNTETLKKNGILKHCPKTRVIGRRNILRNLREQAKVVNQVKAMNGQKEGIESSKKTSPPGVEEKVKESDIMDVVTRTVETSSIEGNWLLRKSNGCLKGSNLPFLTGYAGMPYVSAAELDDSYSISMTSNCEDKERLIWRFHTLGLPPGLSVLGDGTQPQPVVYGIPRKAGNYKVNLSAWHHFNNHSPILQEAVQLKILPSPKYTVINPSERNSDITFLRGEAPYLNLKWKGRSKPIRSVSGFKTGKYYYEVKIHEMGKSGEIGFDSSWLQIPGHLSNSTLNGKREPGVAFWYYSLQGGATGTNGEAFNSIEYDATEFRPTAVKKGDIVMVALDADSGKLWFGLNGKWFWRGSDPAKGEKPTIRGISLPPLKKYKYDQDSSGSFHGDYRAMVRGSEGTHMTLNFGETPWKYSAPAGFSGIPFSTNHDYLPNTWNTETAALYIAVDSGGTNEPFKSTRATSMEIYATESGGGAVLAHNPKSSGRWQFEISTESWPERGRVGIVPSNFNTHKLLRLGEKGTRGISLQRKDVLGAGRGVGLIEIDGELHDIPVYPDNTRFTFDCDFDAKKVIIYADGKEIFKTSLPEVPEGTEWAIGTTLRTVWAHLYTLQAESQNHEWIRGSGVMKYPIKGVKTWGLFNGVVEPGFASNTDNFKFEDEPITSCPSTILKAVNGQECRLPESPFGTVEICTTESQDYACEPNKFGGFFCGYSMDDYPTAETCKKECRTNGITMKRSCDKGVWKE